MTTGGHPVTSYLQRQTLSLLLLFVCGLILSMILAPQYGQSWDDEYDANTGRTALGAYMGYRSYWQTDDQYVFQQRYYGPVFFALSELTVQIVQRINPALHTVDVRHVLNFMSFMICLPAIYHIARRLFPANVSLYLIVLFSTQPLIFGHAFINQKDIPLMTATVWTFWLGLQAFDTQGRSSSQPRLDKHTRWESYLLQLRIEWIGLALHRKLITISTVVLSIFLFLDLSIGLSILPSTKSLIKQMYFREAWQPFQLLFDFLAEDAYKTPLTLYIGRVQRIYLWIRIPIAISLLWIDVHVGRQFFPVITRILQESSERIRTVILAGAVLGITISLRAPAAFIGILIFIFALFKRGLRAWLLLMIYVFSAILMLYLTWPFMWESPLANFVETLQVMSNFPPRLVLYRGDILLSNSLPWHYLPTLLGIQLTIPILILIPTSIGILLLKRMQSIRRILGILLLAWFGLPLTYIIAAGTPLYGNTRQVFFLLPPLIVLAGFALTEIHERLKDHRMRMVVASALLIPGLWGIINLHPYEYAYYNQFIGGTEAAYGRYELDYWCTSYREIAGYLNREAPFGASIVVAGPDYALRNFTRGDLQVYPDWASPPDPDFAVVCDPGRYGDFFSNYDIALRVGYGKAVFGLLRCQTRP